MSEEHVRSIGCVELYRKQEGEELYFILKTGDNKRDLVGATSSGSSRNRPIHDHIVGEFFDFSGLEDALRDHRTDDASLGIRRPSLDEVARYLVIINIGADKKIKQIEVRDVKDSSFGMFTNYASVVQFFTEYCLGDVPSLPRFRAVMERLGYKID